jgi:hypothetical protein
VFVTLSQSLPTQNRASSPGSIAYVLYVASFDCHGGVYCSLALQVKSRGVRTGAVAATGAGWRHVVFYHFRTLYGTQYFCLDLPWTVWC